MQPCMPRQKLVAQSTQMKSKRPGCDLPVSRLRGDTPHRARQKQQSASFQYLCAISMTSFSRRRRAIPQQDDRGLHGIGTFHLPVHAASSPCWQVFLEVWRPSHGFARATQSMRRMRLPVVSETKRKLHCILRRMHGTSARFSTSFKS